MMVRAYVPGEQPTMEGLIKLNTNENPYGCSERVLDAIAKAGEGGALRLYPDPESTALRRALAQHVGVDESEVFVGNGSDEVLAHAFHALLRHDAPVFFPDVTYEFYRVYCALYGIEYHVVPVSPDFSIDLRAYEGPCGGIVLANPNAPTGQALALDAIDALLSRRRECVVLVDEAYVDFGAESAIPLVRKYPNLLVVQTYSKSRSLAGLRVGYAVGQAELIQGLQRVKNSFNSYPLSRPAAAGAIASLADDAYFRECCGRVSVTRERLASGLAELGFDAHPSLANFVFARHPDQDAAELARRLREKAILVRHFQHPRIDQHLRITVGTDEQVSALLSALKRILAS